MFRGSLFMLLFNYNLLSVLDVDVPLLLVQAMLILSG